MGAVQSWKRPAHAAPDQAPFTTVTHWHADEWVEEAGEVYLNDKRTGFLPFLDLPRLAKQPLELALCLAPEDEAREVARLAWRNGHSRAIALLPETDWGVRVYNAFATEWQMLGGYIIDSRRYDPGKADHGSAIKGVLNLDASKARQQKLARKLGRKLQFEPRRRQDIDFAFSDLGNNIDSKLSFGIHFNHPLRLLSH